MPISKKELDQTFSEFESTHGGGRDSYFALLYLSKEFNRKIEDVVHQVAFGSNDYGIDAFHIDKDLRNLYLFQFKWSDNYGLFKDSFHHLINCGIDLAFHASEVPKDNQFLLQLKTALNEYQAVVDRVLVHFVFNGDPSVAEQSTAIDSLREDLEAKKHLIDKFFGGRQITLTFQFISNKTHKLAGVVHTKKTYKYSLPFHQSIETVTPNGEKLHVGLVSLMDVYRMYQDMGARFFERNIRSGLSAEGAPNRSIREALRKIVLVGEDPPEVFLFNHNGISLAAEEFVSNDDTAELIEPRLLNGAQTITSVGRFIDDNQDNELLTKHRHILESVKILGKIINAQSAEFITNVTICNNRQNPVAPWNLRANDQVQLELHDKFREELGIYYEHQESAFENLSDEELEGMGIEEQGRAIQIKKLAQTFLATQGEVDRMSHLPEVFEDEKIYKNTFRPTYLWSNFRQVLLCYKIQFRLNRLLKEIVDKGPQKYWYIKSARNLVWALLIQGLLNHESLDRFAEAYGTQLVMESDFTEVLKELASKRARLIISDALQEERYQEMLGQMKLGFLRSKATFKRCMDVAEQNYGWNKLSF